MKSCVKMINTAGSGQLFSTFSVTLLLQPEDAKEPIMLRDVLIVPGLRRALISVAALSDYGHSALFTKTECDLLIDGKMCCAIERVGDLYSFPVSAFIDGSAQVEASLLHR